MIIDQSILQISLKY